MSETQHQSPWALEYNFDGIVGPTHNYAGLSAGNLASKSHAKKTSHPRRAALEGLAKMRLMLDLGLPQAVLVPHERPSIPLVRKLGLTGSLAASIAELARRDPWLLANIYSASAMWAANAATVSPSADTADGRVHFTPANLASTLHRSFEGPFTAHVLRTIFANEDHFVVHEPLPLHRHLADEGAANHGRFSSSHGEPGRELFVHGRGPAENEGPKGFPRRQSELASRTIAKSHLLQSARVHFIRQSARAIDAGAFHNDVVSVTNQMVLFAHEMAFDTNAWGELSELGVEVIMVPNREVNLKDAISSYLFNSQLVTLPDQTMALIAPVETAEVESVNRHLRDLVAGSHPINKVHRVDVRQSMSNGGGPACLRLRVVMTEMEAASLSGSVVLDHAGIDRLEAWVRTHYREELRPGDLADPDLLTETRVALDELTQILDLGSLYHFQRDSLP